MSVALTDTILFSSPGARTPVLDALALPRYGSGFLTHAALSGSATNNQPIGAPENTQAGMLFDAVNGSLYNRVLVEPTHIDVGNIVSDQLRAVAMWNGFFTPETLTNLQQNAAFGIDVNQPVTVPYTLGPLEGLDWTLDITTKGPPIIDAAIVWTIGGIDYTVTVVGSRIVLFSLPPNWRDPVRERLAWQTDVLTSHNGAEQRIATRTQPRREFDYALLAAGRDAALLRNVLRGWQNRVFAMPVWTDATRLSQSATVGNTELHVHPAGLSFQVGGFVALYADPATYELAEISALGATVQTTRPISSDWPAGTRVFPAVTGRLPTAQPMRQLTSGHTQARVQFRCNPIDVAPYLPAQAAPATYDGHEIITKQPNWVQPLAFDSDYDYAVIDSRTGAWQTDPTVTFAATTRTYRWLFKYRTEIDAFRAFLGRRRGRARPVYLPTWLDDFRLLATVAASSSALTVEATAFETLVEPDAAVQHLVLVTRDGGFYPRRITGSDSHTDGTASVYVDHDFGRQVDPADVLGIHLLPLCRLASDSVELAWKTNGVVAVEAHFKTVMA